MTPDSGAASDAGFDDFVRARWTSTSRLAYALRLDHQQAEDLSEKTVAELMGCSVGSVKSHTSRGLAVLRATLDWRRSPTKASIAWSGT